MSLPSVLNLQLKRFEYDPYRDENYKVNDWSVHFTCACASSFRACSYEFPLELDLTPFVADAVPGANVYILHSILVHSGTRFAAACRRT